jgi:endonuclease YncB( thermonuclease family)
MPLTLIEGQFRIVNAAPDGDSIRFYPNTPNAWRRVGRNVRTNHSGGAQLRLDGIDALETHYQPQRSHLPPQHQPLELGRAAAAEILRFLGFNKVTRGDNETVTSAQPANVPGYILSRFADMYGRPVSFVFPGSHPARDGADVRLVVEPPADSTAALLRNSANFQLLNEGLVYPTFYSRLYPDIRAEMARAAASSRQQRRGIWASDATTSGFQATSFDDLTERLVILPKLFRRLLDYLALNDSEISLDGFRKYVEHRDDRLVILPGGHVTGFDYVINVRGQHVELTEPPENLVFMEK